MNKKNLKTLKAVAEKNLSKAFFALFAIVIIESLISFAFATPAFWFLNKTDFALYSKISAYGLLFLGVFFWFMIQAGFAIMLLRMVREEHFTIGYLFYAFHKFKQFAPVSFFYTVMVGVVSVFIHFAYSFIASKDIAIVANFIQKTDESVQIIAIAAILVLLLSVVLYFLIFMNNFCYDNPQRSVFYFARQSIKLILKKGAKLFVFIFQSGGLHLVRAIFYFFMSIFLSKGEGASALKVIALIFDFLYFVNLYKALCLMFLSVPVFYDAVLNGQDDEVIKSVVDQSENK